MSRTRHNTNHNDPSCGYPCELCGRVLLTKFVREVFRGWDWFCGYGDRPAHFCPQCICAYRKTIDDIRVALDTKPIGYGKNNMLSTDRIVK